jgi:hypothetical protein
MTNESRQVRRARERAEAKANKSKISIIEPFMITSKKFVDRLPVFDLTGLTQSQRGFVNGCMKDFQQSIIMEPEKNPNFAYVMYANSEDFMGTVCDVDDPDEAEQKMKKQWDRVGYPKVGDELTREDLAEKSPEAVFSFDLLKEGGIWPWPNAKSVFEKRGDRLVCIEEI